MALLHSGTLRSGPKATAGPVAFRHTGFLRWEVLMVAFAAILIVLVKAHPGPLPGDAELEVQFQHWLLPHTSIKAVLDAVSTINWPIPSGSIVAVVVLLLAVLRRWLDALVGLLVAVAADLSGFATNQFERRPRPAGHGIHIDRVVNTSFGFPSGHVVHAVAFFGILFFLSYQTRRWGAWMWPLRILLVALIVLMGPSRILEGEHWPSDVLEGAFYGAFWLILGIHLYAWARQRYPKLCPADELAAPTTGRI